MGGRTKDLTGKRFGRLIAIKSKRDLVANKLRTSWLCKCDCGNEKWILAYSFTSGHSQSCGCGKVDHASTLANKYRAYGDGDLTGSFISTIKSGAKIRNIEYSVSSKYLWGLFVEQKEKCALTGLDIKLGSRHKGINITASLDRIDSSKGYVEGNLQWVHKTMNIMKNNMSIIEFKNWCKLVCDYME